MNLLRVDHTAIAVADLDEALARYRRIWGLQPSERQVVPDQHVEIAFLPVGNTLIELVQPTDPESGVARFLQARGEGLHHIGIAVDDIGRELQELHNQGVRLIDPRPRRGLHGLIAFVHPAGTGGVLVELVQHRADQLLQA
jgi:methylmalonyl-CoA/ethylmalonyl-CoA epimerase